MNYLDLPLDFAKNVFEATEASLNEWKSEDNLQFSTLLSMVSVRINSTDTVAVDAFMRFYVRSHPEYRITRGAKGGVMRKAVYEAREAKKEQSRALKSELAQQIENKVQSQLG